MCSEWFAGVIIGRQEQDPSLHYSITVDSQFVTTWGMCINRPIVSCFVDFQSAKQSLFLQGCHLAAWHRMLAAGLFDCIDKIDTVFWNDDLIQSPVKGPDWYVDE